MIFINRKLKQQNFKVVNFIFVKTNFAILLPQKLKIYFLQNDNTLLMTKEKTLLIYRSQN
jgi:hypothetical protein